MSGSKGLAHDYDYNDHGEREIREDTTGGLGDYNDRSCYHGDVSSCV